LPSIDREHIILTAERNLTMIHLLTVGLAALVLGLGLLVTRRSLIVSGPKTEEGIRQLKMLGGAILLLFVLIDGTGIWMATSGKQIQDWEPIFLTGSAVLVVGINSIISAVGRGHERAIWIGAWSAIAIGILLYLAYFGITYILKLTWVGG